MEHVHVDHCCSPASPALRAGHLTTAVRLEYLTVGWNLVEGVIAVSAAALAASVALMGFGIDSFVESAAGLIMIWRLGSEQRGLSGKHLEAIEHRARRLVAGSLFLLAAYVAMDALHSLWASDRPDFSALGIGLTCISITVMLWLARAKRRVARALQSRAMEADAFQTTACWWLSIATLVGVGLNGIFGWWWADPVAALVIAGLVAKEGRAAWAGESDCC